MSKPSRRKKSFFIFRGDERPGEDYVVLRSTMNIEAMTMGTSAREAEDALKEKVTNPLRGVKIGAYYGCMLLRPSKVLEFDDPGDPVIMEDFIRAIGAEPVIYPFRNECCGGYLTMDAREIAKEKSTEVTSSALANGAEMLVTACPLCMYNLKKQADGTGVKVTYFTELLAEALDIR